MAKKKKKEIGNTKTLDKFHYFDLGKTVQLSWAWKEISVIEELLRNATG